MRSFQTPPPPRVSTSRCGLVYQTTPGRWRVLCALGWTFRPQTPQRTARLQPSLRPDPPASVHLRTPLVNTNTRPPASLPQRPFHAPFTHSRTGQLHDPPPGCWWVGAQSLVVADEMRHLQSYLGPLDHLIGAVVHLVTVDYEKNSFPSAPPITPRLGTPGPFLPVSLRPQRPLPSQRAGSETARAPPQGPPSTEIRHSNWIRHNNEARRPPLLIHLPRSCPGAMQGCSFVP
jgi:hypothetical protein